MLQELYGIGRDLSKNYRTARSMLYWNKCYVSKAYPHNKCFRNVEVKIDEPLKKIVKGYN